MSSDVRTNLRNVSQADRFAEEGEGQGEGRGGGWEAELRTGRSTVEIGHLFISFLMLS